MPLAIATFNVKDLFEPASADESDLYAQKLAHIVRLLGETDADIIGLQELGSETCVRSIARGLPGAEYAHIVVGTPDARNIRCALISRRPLLASAVHTQPELAFPVFVEGDSAPFPPGRIPLRRGVVHARVAVEWGEPQIDADTIDIFVCHFKSKLPVLLRTREGTPVEPRSARAWGEANLRSLACRSAEALFVRGLVDDQLELVESERACIVVMGDLNDTIASPPIELVRGGGAGELFSCAELVETSRRFSVLHRGVVEQIDHILVSRALRSRLVGARFLNRALRDHGPFDPNAAPTIDSDHAPMIASFA